MDNVTLEDINLIQQSKTFEFLSNDGMDSSNIAGSIRNFTSESPNHLKGEAWDQVRGKYNKYDEVFFLFGKETKGLPEELLKKYIDKAIRIPMKEGLRSLNLSNSVAIVVYEVLRQNNFNDLEQISNYFN